MKRIPRSSALLFPVLLLVVLAACQPGGFVYRPGPGPGPGPGPSPSRVSVGRVRVDAAVVFVNDRPVAGTVPLFIGDDVRTGDTGRATIFFDAGGSLVIGPRTDPLLQVVSEVGCLGTTVVQVLITSGTFDFFNVTKVCFCDPNDLVCGAPSSDFRVVITKNGASITVSRGALRITVGPLHRQRKYRLLQGQTMRVEGGGKTRGPQPIKPIIR
jgi:hypothetical protein